MRRLTPPVFSENSQKLVSMPLKQETLAQEKYDYYFCLIRYSIFDCFIAVGKYFFSQ